MTVGDQAVWGPRKDFTLLVISRDKIMNLNARAAAVVVAGPVLQTMVVPGVFVVVALGAIPAAGLAEQGV
jgi:hypothetical protein